MSEPGDPETGSASGLGSTRLGPMSWPDVDASSGRVLLVPVGSCEQHGPHLPLDTDTRVATAVAAEAADRRRQAVVAPPVTVGASGEHAAFAGTLSMGTEVLADVLVELVRSAIPDGDAPTWCRAVVLVNGHGGNADALGAAVLRCRAEGRSAVAWSPRIPGGDAHAGRTETSLLLAIAPETVGASRPVGDTTPVDDLLDRLRAGGVAAVSPNGVLGDARGADAAAGRRILADLVDDLVAVIDALG